MQKHGNVSLKVPRVMFFTGIGSQLHVIMSHIHNKKWLLRKCVSPCKPAPAQWYPFLAENRESLGVFNKEISLIVIQYIEIRKMIWLKHEQNYLEKRLYFCVFLNFTNYDQNANNTYKYIKDKLNLNIPLIQKLQLNQLLTICHLTLLAWADGTG